MTTAWSWRAEALLPEVVVGGDWDCSFLPAAEVTSLTVRHAAPSVVSLKVDSASAKKSLTPAKVFSVRFPQLDGPTAAQPAISGASQPASPVAAALTLHDPLREPTRLRPPADLVKLEDRLYYLLQPPLETWFGEGALELPHNPFPYQLAGIAFLYPRYAAVLADEMGLGKTMQAITTIRLLLRSGEARQVLLICPKPLVSNWQREFARWAPEVPLAVVEGDQTRRAWQWRMSEMPVKVANYELVVRDRELLSQAGIDYDLVVLDESQRIKNRSSSTSEIVRSIPRKRSWALTGTPVENSAEDLAGIFEFVRPGLLQPDMKPSRMGKLASDYIIRRTKDQVLTDLPPKMIRDADIELTPAQRESYRLAEEQGVLRLTEMGEGATIQHVFELVLRLKQICNFDPATGESSKLERLAADLDEISASGQKAIIFSQWVNTLTTLKEQLARFRPLEYHGQVPTKSRDGVLQKFKEDRHSNVLLISYGAGGVGLNLQFASYVFLFDRWWNPAIEDQAINRAHRIGVQSPVTVTRFLAAGTIEERINLVLEQKREIFDTVFSYAKLDDGQDSSGLSRDEIFGLFKLRSPRGSSAAAA